MQLEIIGQFVNVSLSERNLLALLAEFDLPPRSRSPLIRRVETGELLIVAVENDIDHYGDRRPGPAGDDFAKPQVPA